MQFNDIIINSCWNFFFWGELTYIFFWEDPGEAEIAGHLGFEESVFPQVSIQAICCRRDLDADKR